MFSPAEAGRLYDAAVTRRDLFDPSAYDCRSETHAPARPSPLRERLRLWFIHRLLAPAPAEQPAQLQ